MPRVQVDLSHEGKFAEFQEVPPGSTLLPDVELQIASIHGCTEAPGAPMKMKYRGMALKVLFVSRKCSLSCCGRLGESKVIPGTVTPPKPTGKGGTSAGCSPILTC